MLSLGANAEYGNVAGAVFNIVTRQGSNQFHGDTQLLLPERQPDRRETPTDEQDDGQPYNRAKFIDTHHAARRADPQGQAVVLRLVPVPAGLGVAARHADRSSRPSRTPSATSTSSTTASTRTTGCSSRQHDDFYEIPERATADTAPSTISLNNGHNPSPGLLYTAVINPTTVVEARYSGFYGTADDDPLNGGRASPGASRTSTPATSPAASTTGTTASRSRPRSPARSPSTPTTSSARSTTSRSACSTTAAAASR